MERIGTFEKWIAIIVLFIGFAIIVNSWTHTKYDANAADDAYMGNLW